MNESTRDSRDLYYIITIDAYALLENAYYDIDEFELGQITRELGRITEKTYREFRLEEYASEYNCFIRDKVYHDTLKYNPYNPKQIQ